VEINVNEVSANYLLKVIKTRTPTHADAQVILKANIKKNLKTEF